MTEQQDLTPWETVQFWKLKENGFQVLQKTGEEGFNVRKLIFFLFFLLEAFFKNTLPFKHRIHNTV